LLILLLVPGVGRAGQEAPATPPPSQSATVEQLPPASSAQPGTQPQAPRRLREEREYECERSRPSQGVRIFAETGAGLLTSAGLGVVGLLVGTGMCWRGLAVEGVPLAMVGSIVGYEPVLGFSPRGALVGLGGFF